jgi:3-oxoacyl-[acyl-carrier protein] reductase
MRFDGKVAVVTGASRGIGKATALAPAREGCTVVVDYSRSEEKARDVVEAIRAVKSRAIAVRCDVSVRSEVEAMFKTTVGEFGKVDILVSNAGIAVVAPILETTDDVWDRTLNTNLKSVFLCTQAASKAGVIQITRSAALELGQYGINVNCVAPGAIDTETLRGELTDQKYAELIEGRKKISSLGAIGKPEDVANAVLFFASDDSRFITGKTLLVDGGRRDFI